MRASQLQGRLAHWAPALASVGLALLVLGPLLKPGYVLTLDMVFGPNGMVFFEEFSTGYPDNGRPFIALVDTISHFLPIDWFQKALLFLVLAASAYFAMRLCPARLLAGKLFAGAIYAVNPFVYTRFMAGHLRFLIGYSLAPLALITYLNFVAGPSARTAILAAAMTTLIGIFSLQAAAMLLGIFVVLVIYHLAAANSVERIALLRGTACFTLSWITLNLYWLPYEFVRGTRVADLVTTEVFQILPSSALASNVFLTLLSLHGFWRSGYAIATNIAPWLMLLFPLFLFLAIFSFSAIWRQRTALVLVTAVVISYILAAGPAGPLWPMVDWLQDKAPFLRGFRDSQRLLLPVAVAYSYFGGLAVSELWGKTVQIQPRWQALGRVALSLVVVGPLAYTFTMLWGFNGYLTVHQYPQDWNEARQVVDQDPAEGTLLFLPWNLYQDYPWIDQRDERLVVPARAVFDRQIIHSEDPQLLAEHRGGLWDKALRPILAAAETRSDLGSQLVPLSMRYVVLSKSADYERYAYLYDQADLELVLDGESLALFRNRHPVSLLTLNGPVLKPLSYEQSGWFGFPSYSIRIPEGEEELFFIPPVPDPANWRLDDVSGTEIALPLRFRASSGVITFRAAPFLILGRVISLVFAVTLLALILKPLIWHSIGSIKHLQVNLIPRKR